MSTRGLIARTTGESTFEGRYLHWDNYPTERGKQLLEMLHSRFKTDLSAMLHFLIDEHSAGWSVCGEKCFCHGDRHEEAQVVTEKDDCGAEWAYVFDEEQKVLHVCRMMVRRKGIESTVTGMFGFGVDGQYWQDVARIELDKIAEVNWDHVECGENFERCGHYAWKHLPALRDKSNLGMQTWLGREPMNFRDVVAFIVNGQRVKNTGCGGNSDYLRSSKPDKSLPPNTWIQTVVYPNRHRVEIPVAIMTPEGEKPFPGVQWIFPPTFLNPNETVFPNMEEETNRVLFA